MNVLLLLLWPIVLVAAPVGALGGIVSGLASAEVLSWKVACAIWIVGSLVWGLIVWKIQQ